MFNNYPEIIKSWLQENYPDKRWHKVLNISRNNLDNVLSGRRKPGDKFFTRLSKAGFDINLLYKTESELQQERILNRELSKAITIKISELNNIYSEFRRKANTLNEEIKQLSSEIIKKIE